MPPLLLSDKISSSYLLLLLALRLLTPQSVCLLSCIRQVQQGHRLHQVSRFLPEKAHFFPSLRFGTTVLIETFLVALDIPGHISFCQCFSFPNLIHGCSDSFSVFFPGYLTLVPPSVGLVFVLEFIQRLLVHPCRPPDVFA